MTGRRGHRHATLALGFGATGAAASSTAGRALAGGFERAARRYAAGWHAYLRGLDRPRSAARHRTLYDVSAMVLAALEDKTYRGAGIASPSMAWVWGLEGYSGPYHLVWSRDLYQVATAQIAAGDRAAAGRALDYLWEYQQGADGCLPQNPTPTAPRTGPTSSSTRSPTRSCSRRSWGAPTRTTWSHVERAAECIIARARRRRSGGRTPSGYSPATIAAEIAALVCAAEIAERNGARAAAARYLAKADEWQRKVEGWTRTTNGPLSDSALLPPPHHRRQRERGHDLHDRRRRPDDRPAPRRRHELPRARAARGQARRRPLHPLDAAGRRPRARRRRRRAASSGTATTTTATARRPTAARSPARATAAGCGRCSRASAASTSCWRGSRGRRRDGSTRSPRPRARAGCCPSRCGTTSRRRAPRCRHGHGVGDAAGLDARAVHPPRLVARRRAPGRAAARGRLPLRQALSLSATAQVAWPRFSR